jgi:radical SAM superfamily enzyme YgiQ (UPF0313 family)
LYSLHIQINKKTSIEVHKKAVKFLRANDIEISASFIVKPDFTKEDFKGLRNYCRELDLYYAGFTVLTPLPGTELYEEYKDKLIVDNYDFYDLFHPVIKTHLPLKEFFSELAALFEKSRTPARGISLLMKHSIKKIPSTLSTYMGLLKSIRNSYKHYDI